MQAALVTGGAGFIGSHLVERLVRNGTRVRVLDDLSTGSRTNLEAVADRIEFVEGDVARTADVDGVMDGVEVVFHLASLVSVPESVSNPRKAHEATATGTLNVLESARAHGVRRVVYSGSCSVYGSGTAGQVDESRPPNLLSPYAAAKFAGEAYCEAYTHSLELETVRLRYFNVFGPRQDPTGPYSAVIPLFVSLLLRGEQPKVHGDGRQTRDFVYVDSVVDANLAAATAERANGGVYNIGTGESRSILDMLRAACDTLGKPFDPVHGPARVGDVRDSRADVSAARRDLGYDPSVNFDEGLRRTIEWFAARERS